MQIGSALDDVQAVYAIAYIRAERVNLRATLWVKNDPCLT